MRLYQQLVLFMLGAVILPLSIGGFWLLRLSEQQLRASIEREQRAISMAVADSAGQALISSVDRLARAAELIDWPQASLEEIRGGLSLLFQQTSGASAVMLVGADAQLRGQPVFLENATDEHPAFALTGIARLLSAVSLQTLSAGGRGQAAVSGIYAGAGGAAVAIAVTVAEGAQARVIIAELGLNSLRPLLRAKALSDSVRADLLDEQRRIVVSSSDSVVAFSRVESEIADSLSRSGMPITISPSWFVSFAPVPSSLGLVAAVRVPMDEVLAPVRALRRKVLLFVGAGFALLLALGLGFTRRINQRVRAVVQGAGAFSRGNLLFRIPEQGSDELAELAVAFNQMGTELEASRARLLTWNDELKVRVDEATRELQAAQAQLLEAQKLAAVGQLGAGVAHEINNPLAGILGNAQLLLMDRSAADPDFQSLQKIEQCAKRCKEITQSLLKFAERSDSPAFRPMDFNALVQDTLSLAPKTGPGAEDAVIELQLSPDPMIIRGDPAHLAPVILALLANARTAVIPTAQKRVVFRTLAMGDECLLRVEDSGKGISAANLPRIFEPFFTTKDIWSNVGLGLSVAYRTVTEHSGKIDVASEEGKGTTFTVRFPKAVG